MQRLDRLHLEFPFAGSRMLRGLLAAEGCKIGRRHVTTLMRRMAIEALYGRPRTTRREPGHKIQGMEITRPNQVWAKDITYIPIASGSPVSPWCWTGQQVVFCGGGCRSPWKQPSASRRWSNALARHGKPDIFNTDQALRRSVKYEEVYQPSAQLDRNISNSITAGVPIRVLTQNADQAYFTPLQLRMPA